MISWDISVFITDMLRLAINFLPVLCTHKKLIYIYTTSGYFKIIITAVSVPTYWIKRRAIWKFITPAMFYLILEWLKSCLDKEVSAKKNAAETRGNCEIDREAHILEVGMREIYFKVQISEHSKLSVTVLSHAVYLKLNSEELIYSNNKDYCFYLFFLI